MKLVSLQHIPLAAAYLCPNCSSIGNNSKQCPACASPFLLNLATVLDRAPEGQAQPQAAYDGFSALAAA